MNKFHTEVLTPETKRALGCLSEIRWLKRSGWYLAGGTALALEAGHRQSVDLDFFNPRANVGVRTVIKRLPKDNWETDILREDTLYGKLFDAKVSFIAYPFFIPRETPRWYGAVRVLRPHDIAVMKILAVSQRGRKRDFVDLYWYVSEQESLLEVLQALPLQYPTFAHNYHHILKSLMYFSDAEDDPMPKLFFKADWRTIKTYFRREVPRVTKKLLKLE